MAVSKLKCAGGTLCNLLVNFGGATRYDSSSFDKDWEHQHQHHHNRRDVHR